MKIESDPQKRRPFTYETKKWLHYGFGEGWDYGRCNVCVQQVYSVGTLNEYTLNCWKILIFENAVTDFNVVKNYLIQRAHADRRLMGKIGKWGKSLALVYTTSELERDVVRKSIFDDLKSMSLLKKNFLPYRRGCKVFEKVLGPRKQWDTRTQRRITDGLQLKLPTLDQED